LAKRVQIVVDAEAAVAAAADRARPRFQEAFRALGWPLNEETEPVLEDSLRAFMRYGVSEGIAATVRSSKVALARLGVELSSESGSQTDQHS